MLEEKHLNTSIIINNLASILVRKIKYAKAKDIY